MTSVNIAVIVVVAIVAIALLLFVITRNNKDIKELTPESTDDTTAEIRTEQENQRVKE